MGQGDGVGKAPPPPHLHRPCCSPPGALKSYLRELPQPLMTFELYDEWVKVARWVGEGEKPHGTKKAHGQPRLSHGETQPQRVGPAAACLVLRRNSDSSEAHLDLGNEHGNENQGRARGKAAAFLTARSWDDAYHHVPCQSLSYEAG